jgi:hypothetical protein
MFRRSVTVMAQTLYIHFVISVYYEKHIKKIALNMLLCCISKMETINKSLKMQRVSKRALKL